jgi:hypothetical protein
MHSAEAIVSCITIFKGSTQGEIISACPIVGGSLISSRVQAYDSPR